MYIIIIKNIKFAIYKNVFLFFTKHLKRAKGLKKNKMTDAKTEKKIHRDWTPKLGLDASKNKEKIYNADKEEEEEVFKPYVWRFPTDERKGRSKAQMGGAMRTWLDNPNIVYVLYDKKNVPLFVAGEEDQLKSVLGSRKYSVISAPKDSILQKWKMAPVEDEEDDKGKKIADGKVTIATKYFESLPADALPEKFQKFFIGARAKSNRNPAPPYYYSVADLVLIESALRARDKNAPSGLGRFFEIKVRERETVKREHVPRTLESLYDRLKARPFNAKNPKIERCLKVNSSNFDVSEDFKKNDLFPANFKDLPHNTKRAYKIGDVIFVFTDSSEIKKPLNVANAIAKHLKKVRSGEFSVNELDIPFKKTDPESKRGAKRGGRGGGKAKEKVVGGKRVHRVTVKSEEERVLREEREEEEEDQGSEGEQGSDNEGSEERGSERAQGSDDEGSDEEVDA